MKMKRLLEELTRLRVTIILTAICLAAWLVLRYLSFFGELGLWLIMAFMVSAGLLSTIFFFRTEEKAESMYYYIALVAGLIWYFAFIYWAVGIIDTSTGQVVKNDWLNATYFSIVTWTTLGYGDFKPVDDLKPFVMAEALIGHVFMALLAGKLLFILTRKKSDDQQDKA